jgi:hypothetical protein
MQSRISKNQTPQIGPSKVRTRFEEAHRFEKCASWKTPEIPSKALTFFEEAHAVVRNYGDGPP